MAGWRASGRVPYCPDCPVIRNPRKYQVIIKASCNMLNVARDITALNAPIIEAACAMSMARRRRSRRALSHHPSLGFEGPPQWVHAVSLALQEDRQLRKRARGPCCTRNRCRQNGSKSLRSHSQPGGPFFAFFLLASL